ncbi:hypothetical protein dsx2_0188 [Desulfovibrio sp. X2]|uniref:PLDc N-terminal domain-containing protein n=1 Tax=Desulfovibrio sp. X2 TaxID=941449 RepID=UPI0003588F1A|nr:PLDc N-terminal domain-containing protein [Desulfovibrio sp. X2]EPR42261.1 hypothetical protein dsx2_0188 [Desulfovibrio sp. X2]
MTILGLTFSTNVWGVVLGVLALFVLMTWWAIRDAFARDFDSTNEKMFWVQICTIIPFLGVLAYVGIGRKRGRKAS